jgi:hypothetical protein
MPKQEASVPARTTGLPKIASGISGLCGVQQTEGEGDREQGGGQQQAEDRRRGPGIAQPAPGQRQHERGRRAGQERGPEHIKAVRPLVARQAAQLRVGHGERQKAERQVDPEDRRPMQVFGEEPAEHRPGEARGHEDAGDINLIARALPRRDDVGDDRLRERNQAASAKPLQSARQNKRQHGRRERAGGRADHEDGDAGEQGHAPPVDVAELAVERRHGRRGEEVGRDDPGQVRDIVQVAPDRRQGGGDDRLIERRQQHRQHDADYDRPDLGVRQRWGLKIGSCVQEDVQPKRERGSDHEPRGP